MYRAVLSKGKGKGLNERTEEMNEWSQVNLIQVSSKVKFNLNFKFQLVGPSF